MAASTSQKQGKNIALITGITGQVKCFCFRPPWRDIFFLNFEKYLQRSMLSVGCKTMLNLSHLLTGPYNYQKALYTGKHFYLPKSTEKTHARMGSVCSVDYYFMCVGK